MIDDNMSLPKGAIGTLSVRAQNVLNAMDFPKTYGGIRSITEEMVLAQRNSGRLTASQIMQFRDGCLSGRIQPEDIAFVPRANDHLSQTILDKLSARARNILRKYRINLTPHGICSLDRGKVSSFEGAGIKVVEELMAFKERCASGDVWNDDTEVIAEVEIFPSQFNSLSEYVIAVAERVCRLGRRDERILAEYLGLLNVEKVISLEALGAEFGGLTRERVRQIAAKLERCLFSQRGRKLFENFVQDSEAIFSHKHGVLKNGEYVAGLNNVYPTWSGTTEFSALLLLKHCGVTIEQNASGRMAWMTGSDIEKHYDAYHDLLENTEMPIENLAPQAVVDNADALGLVDISEDECYFIVQRLFDNTHRHKGEKRPRWNLFLRLRCGLPASRAERRRYAISRALRNAGMCGLTHAEIVSVCHELDPMVDIGDEATLDSDASPILKYDMDGTGARLIIFDYGDPTHDKRYSLDVFFRDEDLIRVVKTAGIGLRKHMEKNCLGVANITRLQAEILDALPDKYSEGIPSACLYFLMREHEAGGLKYYDHPNVAHPAILDRNGKVPERALYWLVYEYFLMAGHESATYSQLVDFCEVMLGMDGVIAAATVVQNLRGEKAVIDGEERYLLKAPDESIDPPNVLIEGGIIDSELAFCVSHNALGMKLDANGKALDINTYVRAFLHELSKSGYTFTSDEKAELADPGWCAAHLGINKPALILAALESSRPNTNYWRSTYRFGTERFWVSSYWIEKFKFRFDNWAQSMAARAGFVFAPYEIPGVSYS